MPKIYIAYDDNHQTPLVVDKVLGLTAARAHLNSQRVRVLCVNIRDDGVITRHFATLQNYEEEQKREINTKLQQLHLEKQRLKSLLVNLHTRPQ